MIGKENINPGSGGSSNVDITSEDGSISITKTEQAAETVFNISSQKEVANLNIVGLKCRYFRIVDFFGYNYSARPIIPDGNYYLPLAKIHSENMGKSTVTFEIFSRETQNWGINYYGKFTFTSRSTSSDDFAYLTAIDVVDNGKTQKIFNYEDIVCAKVKNSTVGVTYYLYKKLTVKDNKPEEDMLIVNYIAFDTINYAKFLFYNDPIQNIPSDCTPEEHDANFVKYYTEAEFNAKGYDIYKNYYNRIELAAGENITITPNIDDYGKITYTISSTGGGSSDLNLKNGSGESSLYQVGGATSTTGKNALALGQSTASGEYSSSKGVSTTASGHGATAEGFSTTSSGEYSHAEGSGSSATGDAAHAEGDSTANGQYSHAEGYTTSTQGRFSHAEGFQSKTVGFNSDAAHAEGHYTEASGGDSHTEGYTTKATNLAAHAEGYFTNATNQSAHAEGMETIASGLNSHAEGYLTEASGADSHSEGDHTKAQYQRSHAEGYLTEASGDASHAEGYTTIASGTNSHAEGNTTTASGANSHSSGTNTNAVNNSETACGKNNRSYTNDTTHGTTIFSVGVGADTGNRKNGLEVNETGEVFFLDSTGAVVKLQDVLTRLIALENK